MGYPPPPYHQPPRYGPPPYRQAPSYGAPPSWQPHHGPSTPARNENLPLIVLLVVGLPLLLAGGGASLAIVLTEDGGPDARGSATMVMPSREPLAGTPGPAQSTDPAQGLYDPAQAQPTDPAGRPPASQPASQGQGQNQGQGTAGLGGTIALQATDPGLKVTVTVNRVIDPATPAGDFLKPEAGKKLVAVELTLANTGQTDYDDTPLVSAWLIDHENHQYTPGLDRIREGQAFGGSVSISGGDSRKGVVVFEVPQTARPAKLQYAIKGGLGSQRAEWTLA
ncbi:DUF4352 domain-containing protein [Nonomuraea sp. NPDC049309]|uniref:DUF4352 domain-containing protein n=1 Tax=Nonomuraea sp. NPDC049309 TaxID=3364350 RepID=UPI0037109422